MNPHHHAVGYTHYCTSFNAKYGSCGAHACCAEYHYTVNGGHHHVSGGHHTVAGTTVHYTGGAGGAGGAGSPAVTGETGKRGGAGGGGAIVIFSDSMPSLTYDVRSGTTADSDTYTASSGATYIILNQ